MANHLDLEEQEQLDQLKHFWKRYGNQITGLLTAVLLAFAAWNGYQYWQQHQAKQAAALFDELERVASQGDLALVERAFNDMKAAFPRTTYAHQGALMVARVLHQGGKAEPARAALAWLADSGADEGYKAIGRLRLSALLIETKAYDQALAQLSAPVPDSFAALVADRRGDILSLQGKPADAKAAYAIAYKALDERDEYRRLVEIKLNALGVDPKSSSDGAGAAGAVAQGASK